MHDITAEDLAASDHNEPIPSTFFYEGRDSVSDNNTAAGWYPSPNEPAAERYFDGTQWTEHRRPLQAPPAPVVAEATAQPSMPFWKRKRFLIPVGSFVLLVGISPFLPEPEEDAANDAAPITTEVQEATTTESATTNEVEQATTTTAATTTEAPATIEVETLLVTCLDGTELNIRADAYGSEDEAYEASCGLLDELHAAAQGAWEDDLAVIVASEDSLIAQARSIDDLGRSVTFVGAEREAFFDEMVEAAKSGEIMTNTDPAYLSRMLFVSRALLDDSDSPQNNFVFDYYQVARDLFRQTEERDGSFIQANMSQLNDAIAEQGW